jgi:hypothetical protein
MSNKRKPSKRQVQSQYQRCVKLQTLDEDDPNTIVSHHISPSGHFKQVLQTPAPELKISIAPLVPPTLDEQLLDDIESDAPIDDICNKPTQVHPFSLPLRWPQYFSRHKLAS